MSDTFKFLNNKQGQGSGAAQDFLNEKLSKNKYSNVSNPDNPYSMGEGSTPGGEGYDDQRVVTNQDEIDAYKAKNGAGSASGAPDDWSFKYNNQIDKYGSLQDLGFDEDRITEIRNHASGLKGSKEANSFGFTADTEHNFKELEDKTTGGSIEADMRKISQHLGFEHSGTLNHKRVLDYIMEGETKKDEGPKPEYEMKPIEHSAEIKQAKERVQNYEQDVMSGKTSNEIYGKGEAMAEDKYVFDATQGSAGIGSSPVSASDQASTDATASFLNKKVSDTKDKYQFSPTS